MIAAILFASFTCLAPDHLVVRHWKKGIARYPTIIGVRCATQKVSMIVQHYYCYNTATGGTGASCQGFVDVMCRTSAVLACLAHVNAGEVLLGVYYRCLFFRGVAGRELPMAPMCVPSIRVALHYPYTYHAEYLLKQSTRSSRPRAQTHRQS